MHEYAEVADVASGKVHETWIRESIHTAHVMRVRIIADSNKMTVSADCLHTSPRILCVGDSLTAGYHGSLTEYAPYANELSKHLGVEADDIGMSGWRSLLQSSPSRLCRFCAHL